MSVNSQEEFLEMAHQEVLKRFRVIRPPQETSERLERPFYIMDVDITGEIELKHAIYTTPKTVINWKKEGF